MNRVPVLIVESSITYKKMLQQVAERLKHLVRVNLVTNQEEAMEQVKNRNYELVLLDVETPHFDALLQHVRSILPRAYILILSRPSNANLILSNRALEIGATEVFTKPINQSYQENIEILESHLSYVIDEVKRKVHEAKYKDATIDVVELQQKLLHKTKELCYERLVVIASSTGGPSALEQIVSKLPADYPYPILIVQHTLPRFTDTLAQSLNNKTALCVKVAEERDQIQKGQIYIAPSGKHMLLDSNLRIRLEDSALVNGVRPAADCLFHSVAEQFQGEQVLAVILTGMGRDGEQGVKELKEKLNCTCIAQSEASCVIYGMPRAVIEEGLADRVVDLQKIAFEILRFVK